MDFTLLHHPDPQRALADLLKELHRGGLDDFQLLETIGEGSFGKVKLAKRKNDQMVAIKFLSKSQIESTNAYLRVLREIVVLNDLEHPNIANILQVCEDEENINLVLEYATGGELYGYLNKNGVLAEAEAKFFLKQIVDAVGYCHAKGIVHRDLKLENCLLTDGDSVIKLIDFGFTNNFGESEHLKTFCGSTDYAAPEMLQHKNYYAPPVDVWSIGVILYAMVTGDLPFTHSTTAKTCSHIMQGLYHMPSKLSTECKNLIARCLAVDVSARITIAQMQNHPFYTSATKVKPIATAPALTSTQEPLLSSADSRERSPGVEPIATKRKPAPIRTDMSKGDIIGSVNAYKVDQDLYTPRSAALMPDPTSPLRKFVREIRTGRFNTDLRIIPPPRDASAESEYVLASPTSERQSAYVPRYSLIESIRANQGALDSPSVATSSADEIDRQLAAAWQTLIGETSSSP